MQVEASIRHPVLPRCPVLPFKWHVVEAAKPSLPRLASVYIAANLRACAGPDTVTHVMHAQINLQVCHQQQCLLSLKTSRIVSEVSCNSPVPTVSFTASFYSRLAKCTVKL